MNAAPETRRQFHAALGELETAPAAVGSHAIATDLHPVVPRLRPRGHAERTSGAALTPASATTSNACRPKTWTRCRSWGSFTARWRSTTRWCARGARPGVRVLRGAAVRRCCNNQLAAYPLIVELLSRCSKTGWISRPALTEPSQQVGRLTDLANAFYQMGQTTQARTLDGLNVQRIDVERKAAADLGRGPANLDWCAGRQSARNSAASTGAGARSGARRGGCGRLAQSYLTLLTLYVRHRQWEAAEAAYRAFGDQPPN